MDPRMVSEDIVARVKDLLRRELKLGENEPLEETTPLSGGDLELDSLDMLLIVTAVEKEFGIKLGPSGSAGAGDGEGGGEEAGEAGAGPETFASVASLAAFVEERTGAVSRQK